MGKVKRSDAGTGGGGGGSSGISAAFARNNRERVIPGLPTAAPKVSKSASGPTSASVPSKAALKNAKRKEARKQSNACGAGVDDDHDHDCSPRSHAVKVAPVRINQMHTRHTRELMAACAQRIWQRATLLS